MRKLIAAINMTLDGYCDHTSVVATEGLHDHYADLLRGAGIVLYGRITYELMQYWQTVVENPTGDASMDDFAAIMDRVPKVVFSRTLTQVDWDSARLATRELEDEAMALKQESGKDIYIGSPSLIVGLLKLGLVDEIQVCVHPVIVGSGLPLFKSISESIQLNHVKTKTLDSGAIVLYYEVLNQ